MPFIVAGVASVLVAIGVPSAVATFVSPWILTGGLLGLSRLLIARPPTTDLPAPGAGAQTIKQSVPERIYGVGLVRVSGKLLFFERHFGELHVVVALFDGEYDGIEHYYLHEDEVVLGGGASDFVVTTTIGDHTAAYIGQVFLQIVFGQHGVEAFPAEPPEQSALSTLFPDQVQTTFYGTGITMLRMEARTGQTEFFSDKFPNGRPEPSVAIRMAKVFDPRDPAQDPNDPSTWVFSKNPVLGWLWYECFCAHGPQRDYATAILPVVDIWKAQADICDEQVPIRSKLVNGKFMSDTVPYRAWTKGAGWSIDPVAQLATKAPGTASNLSQKLNRLGDGATYDIVIVIQGMTAGSLTARITASVTGATHDSTPFTTNGTHTPSLTASPGDDTFELVADAAFDGSISLVTMRDPLEANGGATVARYECNYWWDTKTSRESVRAMFIAACDGWMCELPNGWVVMHVGKFPSGDELASLETLTDDDITGFSINRGIAEEDRVNELIVKFTYAPQKFGEVEADPLRDETDIAATGGVLSTNIDLWQVHELNQARRLALREWNRQNETKRGTLHLNLGGLRILGERWIRIQSNTLPSVNDIYAEVRGLSRNVLDGTMQVDWIRTGSFIDDYDCDDPQWGDGFDPRIPVPLKSTTLPVPDNVVVTVVGDDAGVHAEVTFDDPQRDDLSIVVRWRIVGARNWSELIVNGPVADAGSITVSTAALEFNRFYEVQVATRSISGAVSAWANNPADQVSTGSATAPGSVLNLAADTSVPTEVKLTWTAPNSSNFFAARVYRNTTSVFGSATLLATIFGSPNQGQEYDDTGETTGASFYYWVVSINRSNVEGPSASVGPVIVT